MKAESPMLSDVISHTSHGSIILLGVGSFQCLCVHFCVHESARVWCLCKGETVERNCSVNKWSMGDCTNE